MVATSRYDRAAEVLEALRDLLLKVQPTFSARRMWTDILTQEERDQLGNDLRVAYADGKTVGIWMRLHHVSQRRAIIEVARQMDFLTDRAADRLIRDIGEHFETIEQAIEDAIRSCGLVVNERDRQVYFDGSLVELDWHRNQAAWNYFIILCQQAKERSTVDRMLLGDHKDPAYLSKQKSRLTSIGKFPYGLADLIVEAGRGTQRLNLPPDQIRIFQRRSMEVLSELC